MITRCREESHRGRWSGPLVLLHPHFRNKRCLHGLACDCTLMASSGIPRDRSVTPSPFCPSLAVRVLHGQKVPCAE